MTGIAKTLVRAWELAHGASEWNRPAVLLSALSGVPLEDAMRLGVARRDAALLAWRKALFGGRWLAFAQCPDCQEMLEYELPVAEEALSPPEDPIEVEAGGQKWLVRWPDSEDLAAAAACPDRASSRQLLLSRIFPAAATGEFAEPILAAAARAHRARWTMQLECCACSKKWNVLFDAGEFLWLEVRAAARRILREVDAIARIYHWSEAEILAMSQQRRNGYLEMVQ